MKLLTREQILQAKTIRREEVEVPEWHGKVIVQTMSGTQRDAFEASIVKGEGERDLTNLRAKIIALSCVDEKGDLIFKPADILELGKQSAAALDRVFTVARRLSGFSKDDVKELAGNSSEGQSEDSTSD